MFKMLAFAAVPPARQHRDPDTIAISSDFMRRNVQWFCARVPATDHGINHPPEHCLGKSCPN